MKFYHRLHYLIIHFFNQQQMLRFTRFETVTISNMKRMGVGTELIFDPRRPPHPHLSVSHETTDIG
jgi:hypothetical protein